MKLWLSPLVLALLVHSEATTPRFEPTEGLSLRKSFTVQHEASFVELTSNMAGQPVPAEFLPDMDIEFTSAHSVVVVDTYADVGDGWPRAFERTFESITLEAESAFSMEPGGVDVLEETGGQSPLEGETVRFLWDEDAEDWEGELLGDGDTSLADGLTADMDLLAFLPAEDVEEGDTWDVDAQALRGLLEPGGDLALEYDASGPWSEDPRADLAGEVTARLVGWRETEDGRYLAIELEGEMEQTWERPGTLDDIPVTDGTATETSTTTSTITGEIAWSPAGHVLWAELDCPTTIQVVTTRDPGQPGPDFDATVTMSGTYRFEVRAQPER